MTSKVLHTKVSTVETPENSIIITAEENEANGDEKEEEKEEEIPDLGGVKRINKEFGPKYKWLSLFGYIFAFCNGCIMPLFGVLFGELLEILTNSIDEEGNTHFQEESVRILVFFVAMGVGALVFGVLQYGFWGSYGTQVAIDVRKAFFHALIIQDISYHDKKTSAALNSMLTTDANAIENGIGIKYGFAVQQMGAFLFGMSMSFYYSWRVALTLFGLMPILVVIGVIQGKMFQNAGKSADAFVNAGTFGQEVLTNIKTVVALPMLLKHKYEQYVDQLLIAYPLSKKRTAIVGFGIGLFMGGIFCVYAVGLYAGARYVDKGWISVGDLFGSYFTFLIAGMGLGQLGSVVEDLQKARLGANKFFMILERVPEVKQPEIDQPLKISKTRIEGRVEFRNVTFAYASNPTANVLQNVSFVIESGKTLAIVGPSGSGKSTIISLLERFYDPLSGDIFIDDQKIHNFDAADVRNHMGLVSQMPLLFDASIRKNIRGGNRNASDDDIIAAAKIANAHDFILDLPEKYDTNVGEMGGRLSGGQRQRIAIARAMLNRPSILLLDEATSALDSKSEEEVQTAIDIISSNDNQTVISIAHRLSTIKDADVIIVLVDGEIRETGNHESLMQDNDVYASLVLAQNLVQEKTVMHRHHSEKDMQSLIAGASSGSLF